MKDKRASGTFDTSEASGYFAQQNVKSFHPHHRFKKAPAMGALLFRSYTTAESASTTAWAAVRVSSPAVSIVISAHCLYKGSRSA